MLCTLDDNMEIEYDITIAIPIAIPVAIPIKNNSENIFNEINFHMLESEEEKINYLRNIKTETFINNQKWKPIHFICKNYSPKIIKCILDIYLEKNYNLECETEDKWKPIHIICRYSTIETIKYIFNIYLENNYDLECENIEYCNPLHLICFFQTSEIIRYVFDIYANKDLLKYSVCDNYIYGVSLNSKADSEITKYVFDICLDMVGKKNINIDEIITRLKVKKMYDLIKYIRLKTSYIYCAYYKIIDSRN